jgi:hypothetical protein
MKIKKIVFSLFLVGLIFLFAAFIIYPGGSPGGKTGSPLDGSNCAGCHGGSAVTVTGWITSNIPAEGYTAGQNYNITVTATGSGKKGFEITSEANSSKIGTFTAGTGSELTNGGKALTQSSGVNSNPATWTFSWTAPAEGTGNVTFYSAIIVGEPNTKLCTLQVQEAPVVEISEEKENELMIYPNPATEMIYFTDKKFKNAEYKIYSVDGKVFESGKLNRKSEINISLLRSGNYILKIFAGDNIFTKQFVKE